MKLWEMACILGIILLITGAIGAVLWPYTANAWLVYFDKDPTMLWWHGFLLGVFPPSASFMFVAAPVTWVAMMFLS